MTVPEATSVFAQLSLEQDKISPSKLHAPDSTTCPFSMSFVTPSGSYLTVKFPYFSGFHVPIKSSQVVTGSSGRSFVGSRVGVSVGGRGVNVGVSVGGIGVSVGGIAVSVGGTGVSVGGISVGVGGKAVFVGRTSLPSTWLQPNNSITIIMRISERSTHLLGFILIFSFIYSADYFF